MRAIKHFFHWFCPARWLLVVLSPLLLEILQRLSERPRSLAFQSLSGQARQKARRQGQDKVPGWQDRQGQGSANSSDEVALIATLPSDESLCHRIIRRSDQPNICQTDGALRCQQGGLPGLCIGTSKGTASPFLTAQTNVATGSMATGSLATILCGERRAEAVDVGESASTAMQLKKRNLCSTYCSLATSAVQTIPSSRCRACWCSPIGVW